MNSSSGLFKKALIARSAVRLFGGEPDDGHRQWLARKTQADTRFTEGLEQACRALAGVQDLENDPEVAAWADEALQQPEQSQSEKAGMWWKGLAVASLLLAVGVAAINWFVVEESTDTNIQRYVTRIGEQKQVELADGSIVTLNTGTQLLVDITDESRRVILERGEAFFQVARDETRLFSIVLGEQAISVLGTRFSVKRMPSRFTLAVTEGMVSIHPVNESVSITSPIIDEAGSTDTSSTELGQRRVTAGWVVDYDAGAKSLKASNDIDLSKVTSWRHGILHFSNEPLSKVVYELNRYSGKKILIEDAGLMDKPVSASLRIDRLNLALSGLATLYSLQVVHHYDHIVITGKQ